MPQETYGKRSQIRNIIDVLTSYSLFVNEGVEEIRSHVQKIEALVERNFRSSQRQQTLLSFYCSKMQSPLNNKVWLPKCTKIR